MRIIRELVERLWFLSCLVLGRLLRSARYARTRIVGQGGEVQVRKIRLIHAPLLIGVGGSLLRILDTGVRVLPQREWEEREREVHERLRGSSIRTDAAGTLILPFLTGETLAVLLKNPDLEAPVRMRAIELAALALVQLHREGLTHGDAMAENVMVDLSSGDAHWFDFETTHDPRRSMDWRRADDVRALLATCLLRTTPEHLAETLRVVLDAYDDEELTPHLAASFSFVLRRPLPFHLGQAGLSLRQYRVIARLLKKRLGTRRRGSTAGV